MTGPAPPRLTLLQQHRSCAPLPVPAPELCHSSSRSTGATHIFSIADGWCCLAPPLFLQSCRAAPSSASYYDERQQLYTPSLLQQQDSILMAASSASEVASSRLKRNSDDMAWEFAMLICVFWTCCAAYPVSKFICGLLSKFICGLVTRTINCNLVYT
nr:uncharacterized protein LOC109767696 [Aegilops tauschii subsp. strangulata]